MKERVHWIDIAKGLGIIAVVIGHIYHNQMMFNWLYSFHMPLFFFVAGYLYKQKDILTDLKRRIQTIVIPYFAFGSIVLLYWALLERRFRDSSMGVFESVLGLISGEYRYLDFNVHLWFLPCFFVTVCLYNLLRNIGGKKVTYITAIIMSIAYLVIDIPDLPWGIDRVFEYIGFYAIGNLYAESKITEKLIEMPNLKILTGCMLAFASFALSYFISNTGILWFAFGLVGLFAICFISIGIEKSRVLEYLGQISLIVLCVHGPVYRVLIKCFSVLVNQSSELVRSNPFLALMITMCTLVVCAFCFEIVKRIAPWMVGKQKTN